MAISSQLTLGEILLLTVDADPSLTGISAPIGSMSILDDKVNSKIWIKSGSTDTSWSIVPRHIDGSALIAGGIIFSDVNGILIQDETRLFWDNSNKRLGIGLSSPAALLHVDGGNATATYHKFTAGTTTGQTSTDGLDIGIDSTGVAEIKQRENLDLKIYTNNLERLRVDSSGRVIIGGSSAQDVTGTSIFPAFQILGTSATQMLAAQYSNDVNPPAFNLLKSRGATLLSQGLLSSGDEFGRLQFRGSDGSAFQAGASIRAYVDGTAAAGSMPGRLSLLTTPLASVTPVERMRIASNGFISMGGSFNPLYPLHLQGDALFGTGSLTNIPSAPLNLVNSAAGTLKTQLNLVNTGGGAGAGSAIDFHTYDVAGGTTPGARISAIDDNFSAYISIATKVPGAAANAITERVRITNTGQVGIGATPVASAILQTDSTTKGFLQPRMTTTQRLAISSPAEGLQVYDTDLSTVCRYSGTGWFYEFNIANTTIQSTTSATYANLTEFVTPNLYPGNYILEFEGTFQSSATTTGIGLRLAEVTGTISFVSINWRFSQAGNGTDKYYEYSQTSLTDNVPSTATLSINTNYPAVALGIFSISSPGSVAIQIRSEVNGSAVSIRPTSILSIRKV